MVAMKEVKEQDLKTGAAIKAVLGSRPCKVARTGNSGTGTHNGV